MATIAVSVTESEKETGNSFYLGAYSMSNSKDQNSMSNSSYESFIRWQAITRDQFSSVSSLVLGLATGMLAFNSSLLLERKFSCFCSFYFGLTATIFFTLSIGLALWCAINRLRDFRITAKIAKRSGTESAIDDRVVASVLGKTSWRLFWGQLWCFGLGALSETLAIVFQLFASNCL